MADQQIVLGIDLGTSYSCLAVVRDGKPFVIPNEWGEYTHASVVSFLEDGRIIVGNEAKRRMIIDPEHTVYSTKRLIGRFYYSEEVKRAQAVCPYEIVEGPNSGVCIRVYDKVYSLPEISAMVLKEVKAVAENELGQQVSKAVITCPAFFNDNQRQATKDAGRIAGLQVLRIINEPTAAALALSFTSAEPQRIAVYDLGGGTFDVSILDVSKDAIEVVGTAGDTYLGGDDFDNLVMQYCLERFKGRTGVDLTQDKHALQRLKDASERAKITLSTEHEAVIHIRSITRDAKGSPVDLKESLSSVQFATMIQTLIQRTFKVCDEALMAAKMSVNSVGEVILVGGPTRLPMIRESVEHYFGRVPLGGVDPDVIVAAGAALQGAALVGAMASSLLLDVTPLTLRIGTVGGYTEPIIGKNTPLPIEAAKVFTTSRDQQEKVKLRVYQGESRLAQGNELLGEFEFGGFRRALRGEVKIAVNFEIDTDGIVNVSARDEETGVASSTTINLSSGLSEADVEARKAATEKIQLARERGGDRNLPAPVA